MESSFHIIDYVVFVLYAIIIVALGLWVSRTKKGEEKTSHDYFLAGGTLTWWAIGASLIAANISAEHFIGMSGSGYRIGLGIAAYEWMAAITLILVAKYLLPIMIERKIYTMPQFLRQRYNEGVSLAFAIFWLMVYVFVNLTSVAWLGALAMEQILGIPVMYGVIGLFLFAGLYSIYGGLKAVAFTDVLQVVFLVGGGLITAYFALDAVSGANGGAWDGFVIVLDRIRSVPGDMHFNLIVDKASNPSAFGDLPGLAVIFGALWLTNIGYWGFNQYIIQKGLAAKSLHEAKKGLIFGAFLKILIPLIVVIPGITAYVLFNFNDLPGLQENYFQPEGMIGKADEAYPWLLKNFAPIGIRGLAFAALVAAVVSSLASMLNSTSTIFTMDIYKQHINKNATEKQLVKTGRIVAFASLVIALVAAKPLLGGLDQAFQYIQEYTGYIYPGVVCVFGLGLLWKESSARGALWASILTIPAGIAIKLAWPEMPFLLRMGYVFIILAAVQITLSLIDKKKKEADALDSRYASSMRKVSFAIGALAIVCVFLGVIFSEPLKNLAFESIFTMAALLGVLAFVLYRNSQAKKQDAKGFVSEPGLFKTDGGFAFGSFVICLIITALYAYFW